MTKSRSRGHVLLDELDSLKGLLDTEPRAVTIDELGPGDVLAELPRSFTRAPADAARPLTGLRREEPGLRSDAEAETPNPDDGPSEAETLPDEDGLFPDTEPSRPAPGPVAEAVPPLDEAEIPVLNQALPMAGSAEDTPTRADLEALADLLLERRLAELRDALREEIIEALARRVGLPPE